MLTVTVLLGLAAFFCTLGVAVGKVPAWVPTLLLCVIVLLQALPLGR